jgi:phospholipase/carboxylesterase
MPVGEPITLAPLSAKAPRRLMVFLHAAGSSAQAFMPVANLFHERFPGAMVVIPEGPCQARVAPDGRDWFDARGTASERLGRIEKAANQVAKLIAQQQAHASIVPAETVLVGFSQGATVALELARIHPMRVAIVVSYAGQLARPIRPGEHVNATIHLLHGEFDSWVPAAQSVRAARGLRAIGADVTLDIAAEGTHALNRTLVSMGATRVMQTVFRGRRGQAPHTTPTLH